MLGFLRSKRKTKTRISPDKLREGMVVEIPLSWLHHPFFRSRFLIRDKEQINKIKGLGLPFVFLIGEEGEKITFPKVESIQQEDGIKPLKIEQDQAQEKQTETKGEMSSARLHQLKYQQCVKTYQKTLKEIKHLMSSITSLSAESVAESKEMVMQMVTSLLSDPSTMVFLINAKKKQEEVFHHALNTCILSLLLARAAEVSAESMCTIGLGALFHDIGKLRIPKSILLKDKPLTKSEKEFFRLHPKFGTEMVAKIPSFPEQVKKIIMNHHETLDGKGYPRGLEETRIDTDTRIVTIVNIYDNLCNALRQEDSLTPHKALAFMYRKLKGKLDRPILELFIKTMGIFPPGTIVKLSNNQIGTVVSKSSTAPKKPSVMLYDPTVPSSKAPVISLEEEKSLEIIETLHPSALPQEIFNYLNPPLRLAYMLDSLAK